AGGSAAGGSAAGGSPAGGSASPDVTGTFTALNSLANGTTVTTPVNLTTFTIEAYVPNGVAYTVVPGTGQVNGTFTIPGVPAGNVLIRVGETFLETSARQVVFNNFLLGRPSPATATVDPTDTTVNVTGLLPWIAGQDQVVWVSPNVGNIFYNFPLNAAPLTNATTATLSANFNGQKLVNQAQGDDTWLLQYRFTTDGGVSTGTTVGATQLAPFTQLNGQTTTLTASMLLPPSVPSITQALSWNLNAFSVLQTSLPPGVNPRGFLAFSPFPSTTPNSTSVVDSWFVEVPASQLPPTSFTLVTPFPSGWSIVGRTFFTIDAPRQIAGTTGPLNLFSAIGHYDTLPTLTASPITPRLGAVSNLTLNGTPFTADRTSVGNTVALGWTAPTLGATTTYYVTLYRLTTASGAPTTAAQTLQFSTGNTSLVIPSSLLIAGQPYAAQVQAVNAGFNPRVEYGTRAVPQAVSVIATPIFRP
ncbi:MAG: hypothetical protein Q8N26_17155, partial [Myxococcales bacterium]|nr:hypothetical protein [Myxococcales bacterium]